MRTRKLLETKLLWRNLIKGMKTCAVHLVRYSGPFFKWTREELQQMHQRTRKHKIMRNSLYCRDDEESLYGSRKEGGRGLNSIQDRIHASTQ